MSSSYKIITPPDISAEPITISEIKSLLRIDWADDDALIASLISRARALAETVTHRALATQTIQQVDTIERPEGGELSGAFNRPPSWYQYNESLGANPFGPAQFYFDLAMPPVQASLGVTIETKVVAFDPWVVFPQATNLDGSTNTYVDDNREPARIYIQSPVTANFYRFSYTAGYSDSYPIPPDIKQCITEAAVYWYEHRMAEGLPDALMQKLLARRVDWM